MESLQQGTGMHANFRRNVFFWLGVVILPVFWSWFTLSRKHSRLDRCVAFGWMAVVLSVLVLTWPEVAERYHLVLANLQFISLAVGGGLLVWLILRGIHRNGCPPFIDAVVFCWMIALFSGTPYQRTLQQLCEQPLGFVHAMVILVPALFHFTLGPVQKGLEKSA